MKKFSKRNAGSPAMREFSSNLPALRRSPVLFKSCDPARKAAYSLANISPGSRIVCTVTGHGLKDPDVVSEEIELKAVQPNEQDVLRALGL